MKERREPVRLSLTGTPDRDIAGCLLKFKCRPEKAQGSLPGTLESHQTGSAGLFTASKKVRVPQVSPQEVQALLTRKQPIPSRWTNSVYLEWFSDSNGRVVAEIIEPQCEMSLPQWTLEDPPPGEDQEDFEAPMDEFQWEQHLKASDATADRLMELIAQYGHSDEAWEKIEQEMGWDDLEENPEFAEFEQAVSESPVPLELPPRARHPLVQRTQEVGTRLLSLNTGHSDPPECCELTAGKIWLVSAKLAGALTRPENFEPGFIVATLKRALALWNDAMASLESCRDTCEAIPELLEEWFFCRAEIVDLMREYRKEI